MERKEKIKFVIIASTILLGVSAVSCAGYVVNKNRNNEVEKPENKTVVHVEKTNDSIEITDVKENTEKVDENKNIEVQSLEESDSTVEKKVPQKKSTSAETKKEEKTTVGEVKHDEVASTSDKEKIEVEIEGLKDYIYVVDQKNIENNGVVYDIKISEDMKATHNGKSDIYESIYNGEKMKNGKTLPDSKIVITVYDAKDKEGVQETYADMYEMYYNNARGGDVTIGKGSYTAVYQHYVEGYNWDSKCHTIYMIDVNDDKFMVIDIQTFVEASEGWGTMVGELLKTLEIHK